LSGSVPQQNFLADMMKIICFSNGRVWFKSLRRIPVGYHPSHQEISVVSKRLRNEFVDEFDEPEYRSFNRNRNGRGRNRPGDAEAPRSRNRNRGRQDRRGYDDY
jgi:hypothetical protein